MEADAAALPKPPGAKRSFDGYTHHSDDSEGSSEGGARISAVGGEGPEEFLDCVPPSQATAADAGPASAPPRPAAAQESVQAAELPATPSYAGDSDVPGINDASSAEEAAEQPAIPPAAWAPQAE